MTVTCPTASARLSSSNTTTHSVPPSPRAWLAVASSASFRQVCLQVTKADASLRNRFTSLCCTLTLPDLNAARSLRGCNMMCQ